MKHTDSKQVKTKVEKIGKDLREYISKNISDMAESHLECWKDRYANYGGNRRRMEEDIYINHDTSLEIERAEEDLERKLNDTEIGHLETRFNDEVLRQWQNGRY